VLLAAALPALAALVGALGAAAVAVALSARYPIGLAGELEPTPGRHADVAGLAIGVAALAVFGVVTAFAGARRAERRATSAATAAAARWRVGPPLAASIGARLAVAGRREGGGRAATAALTFGVLAVVAALTFGAGLDRAAADGSLSGQTFDSLYVGVGPIEPPADLVAAWRADDRVAAAARITDVVVDVGGIPVALLALDDLKGSSASRSLTGRPPAGPGEVALAPGELRRLGASIGDTLSLADGTALRIVGTMFTPEISHTSYDAGGRVTAEQMAAIVASGTPVKFDALAMRAARPLSVTELDDVWGGREHDVTGVVEAQRNLGRTRHVPRALAWFAGTLAAVTAAVVLVTSTRRRRREVAVLQVLGLTRRQARLIVAWQVVASVGIAVAIGVPAGFAIGRSLWQAVVDGVPLRYVTPTDWAAVSLVVVGLAALAGALAVRPVTMTAADEPALSLRAE
jgi:hypothetical protein